MQDYADAEAFAAFRAHLFKFNLLWNPEKDRGTVDEVLALGGAWVSVIYSEPGTDGQLGFVVDLNEFTAQCGDGLGAEEAAQEILQSFVFDPSGPGRTSNHPRLQAVAAAIPGITWHGDFTDLPLP